MTTDLMAKATAQCLGLDIQTLVDLGFCSPKCILKRELLESKNSALAFVLVPMSRTRLSIEHRNGMVDQMAAWMSAAGYGKMCVGKKVINHLHLK